GERRDNAAAPGPVTEVAPARERPPAPQTESSVDALDRPSGRQRRRELEARVLAPDVVLRLGREEREVPVVDADDAEDPGARAAHSADFHDGLIERARIELVAAIPLGLQAAKKPGVLELREGLVGQPAERLGLIGALAQ